MKNDKEGYILLKVSQGFAKEVREEYDKSFEDGTSPTFNLLLNTEEGCVEEDLASVIDCKISPSIKPYGERIIHYQDSNKNPVRIKIDKEMLEKNNSYQNNEVVLIGKVDDHESLFENINITKQPADEAWEKASGRERLHIALDQRIDGLKTKGIDLDKDNCKAFISASWIYDTHLELTFRIPTDLLDDDLEVVSRQEKVITEGNRGLTD